MKGNFVASEEVADSVKQSMQRLCNKYISGPDDTKGLAMVEDMINWVFQTAGADMPEPFKLAFIDGTLWFGFESEFKQEPPASADLA